ncbi:glutathione S-transferase family protein [Vibrio sp. S4M6]|uniref:glutathione S-transferase family protein n=1 Tax=Vibrio sinus TaxID=2946865 RepID=UPI00202A4C5F|nr:glutathione S-transferase family protein [Vibrio sinus]MCL9783022.1 glutathione S-transferase family protein [Vibrio sinus]
MKLYSAPGTCATAIHIALEWIGKPYEVEHLSMKQMKEPEYLKLNPSGVVPTFVNNEIPYTEAAAILFHLTDAFPEAELGPAVGGENRAEFYRWISFLSGTLHPYYWLHFVPSRFTTDEEGTEAVQEASHVMIDKALTQIDNHLANRPYMLGEKKSVVDALLYPMASWGYGLPKPTSEYPNIHDLVKRLASEEAVTNVHRSQGTHPKV